MYAYSGGTSKDVSWQLKAHQIQTPQPGPQALWILAASSSCDAAPAWSWRPCWAPPRPGQCEGGWAGMRRIAAPWGSIPPGTASMWSRESLARLLPWWWRSATSRARHPSGSGSGGRPPEKPLTEGKRPPYFPDRSCSSLEGAGTETVRIDGSEFPRVTQDF